MSGVEDITIARKKLYVGCSLTLAPQIFKDKVEQTKARLKDDWDVLEFLGLTAGTEVDVYQVDILENVRNCDAFVAIADEPSFGLGWETREAVLLRKPTLLLAHAASKVTRLALGAPHFFPDQHFEFRRYDDMVQEVPMIVNQEFNYVLNPPENTLAD